MRSLKHWARLVWVGIVSLVSLGGNPAAAQTTAYFNDFDGGLVTAPGVGVSLSGPGVVTGVQGYGGLGPTGNQFGGQFLHNAAVGNPQPATVLTLSNLPSHTSLNIQALLAVIDSWDGISADEFVVEVDGVVRFAEFFANASGTQTYTTGQLGSPTHQHRGFNGGWVDQAIDLGANTGLQNIAHTSSSLTLRLFARGQGWQGSTDESWAVENLRITLNGTDTPAVPEPGSVVLFLPALLAIGVLGRKRHKKR